MNKERVGAFTDAVVAIVMTIIVLELKQPKVATWAGVFSEWRMYLAYLVSFLICAVTWNNHHHIFQVIKKVDSKVLWANNFQIFVLTLYPYLTIFVAENYNSPVAELLYGFGFILGNVAYLNLLRVVINAADSKEANKLREVLNSSWQSITSTLIMIVGLCLAYVYPPIVMVACAMQLLIWSVPNKKIERLFD